VTHQPAAASLDAELRARLRQIADELIPACVGMPAASEVGVADRQLDQVLDARPDLVQPLQAALAREPASPATRLLDELAASDAAAHDALLLAIAGGYYSHPAVRRLLGEADQQPAPVRPELVPGYVEEGLLDGVLERGAAYRQVPDDA
jgi:hypothetical protein